MLRPSLNVFSFLHFCHVLRVQSYLGHLELIPEDLDLDTVTESRKLLDSLPFPASLAFGIQGML
jgi:hypothetical protein